MLLYKEDFEIFSPQSLNFKMLSSFLAQDEVATMGILEKNFPRGATVFAQKKTNKKIFPWPGLVFHFVV